MIPDDLSDSKKRENFLKDFDSWNDNGNFINPEKFNNKTFSKHVSNFLTYVHHSILKIEYDELEEYGEKEIILFLFKFGKFKQKRKNLINYTRIELPIFSEIQINKYRKFIKEKISAYDDAMKYKIKKNLVAGICYAHFIKIGFDGNLSSIDPFLKQEDNRVYFERMQEILISDIKSLKKEIKKKQLANTPPKKQSKSISEEDFKNKFSKYTWQEAEDLVGELFRKKGYVVEVGIKTESGKVKRQGDFGIDVQAKNSSEFLGIQVKHWDNDVGFEDVAKTLGVAQKFNKVFIVSTKSGFTQQALTHAYDNPYLIELWDSDRFAKEMKEHMIEKPESQNKINENDIKIDYHDYILDIDLEKIED